jgi:hypothetical protein
MPLRDHFHSPLDDLRHWEGLHGGWPMMIVANLRHRLPAGYFAEPRVHSGLLAQNAYEVRVYDEKCHCRLVAAVEIVCPANKVHPDDRRMFVSKCVGLLQERVSIVIVDIVTTCTQNMYLELLDQIGNTDPNLEHEPTPLYVTACRLSTQTNEDMLETWVQPLHLGQPLPTVPLWLADNLAVPLELEESYEQSCAILNIP